ncbi:MAG: hypothetical protein DRH15_03580 [Deltaproteobacteria bacterium]|nr:MAG: hypothetical protein DRH15_03580 [Deltaproteobacteria bacterium]
MAKKKKIKRKELLKEPDEFLTLSSRLFNWIITHQRQLYAAGIIVASLFVLYMAGYFYYRHINRKAQALYNVAYEALASNMKPSTDAKAWAKTQELFQEVINRYSLSKASCLALSQAAYAAYRQKKYDEAIALYEKFLSKIGDEPNYRMLIQMALAACYEEKGEIDQAIQLLELLSEEKANPFRELALINLARVYRLANKVEDSKRVLKEFIVAFPDSPFLPMEKALLLTLEG